ncbi:hypothetical protein DXT96_21505 [Agrobacterium sp. ICMP 6402]|nr:hypothetical protein [Agrobacterium sp. ICMP 6402]
MLRHMTTPSVTTRTASQQTVIARRPSPGDYAHDALPHLVRSAFRILAVACARGLSCCPESHGNRSRERKACSSTLAHASVLHCWRNDTASHAFNPFERSACSSIFTTLLTN